MGVQRVGVALAAIANDGDALALERVDGRVSFSVDVCGQLTNLSRSLSLSVLPTAAPRDMATTPVRTSSLTPYGRNSSIRLATLSLGPVTSTINEPLATSTMRAR